MKHEGRGPPRVRREADRQGIRQIRGRCGPENRPPVRRYRANRGAGVCRTDLHIVEGIWRTKVEVNLPYIMGHENAGWVEEIGKGVRGRKSRRRGYLPSPGHQRPLPGLSSRRRHARRGQQLSRHQRERRLRAISADGRAHADQIAEDAGAERCGPLHRRRPYRISRGQEGVAASFAGRIRRDYWRRRARPYRNPSAERALRRRDHRRRPRRQILGARQGMRRATTWSRRTAARSRRSWR